MKTSIFQNNNENIVRIAALKFFVASWLWFPEDFVSNIINKEAYKKPQKTSRKLLKNFKAEILTIF